MLAHSKLTSTRPWIFRSRFRLFLSLFLFVAIPSAILTVMTGQFVARQASREAMKQNGVVARLVAKHIEAEFFGLRRYVESFAMRKRLTEALLSGTAEIVQQEIGQMVEQNAKITRAVLTDTNGVLLFDHPTDTMALGKNFSSRDWFQGAFRSQGAYVSRAYERMALGSPAVITIATKVRAKERPLGYLAGQYTIRDLAEWLGSVRSSESERIAVFDQYGKQVLKLAESGFPDISNHPMIGKVIGKPAGARKVQDLDGFGRSFVSHVPVPRVGWTVIAYQDQSVVFAPVRRLIAMMWVFSGVALAAAVLLGWVWQRVIFAYAEDLRRSNDELERVCYSIAHDLRAPVRSMQSFAAILLQEQAFDERGKDYATRIVKSGLRMDRLIHDLLKYGTVAHRALRFEKVNLDEIVDEAMARQHREPQVGINIRKPLGEVFCDRGLLQEIVAQLLSNAVKYVAPGTRPNITVRSDDTGDEVRLWVEDNGIGMDAAYSAKIFGIFERLHAIDEYSGTGVGLAIVKKAAERMGGSVGVASTVGEGSAFWVRLPRR